jgi:hypothetical protein
VGRRGFNIITADANAAVKLIRFFNLNLIKYLKMEGKPIVMSYFHGAQGVTIEGDVTTINANNYIHPGASSRSNSSINSESGWAT